MKKESVIISLIIVLVLCLLVQGYVFSAIVQEADLNAVGVSINGLEINIDTILYKENVYVPVEQICYYLSCAYEKDDELKIINFLKTSKVPKVDNTDRWGREKKSNLKIEPAGYKTMLDGILLFIEPIVYDNTFYIHLKYLAQSFEMETSQDLSRKTIELLDYPTEYVGAVNGEKIKERLFRERYLSRTVGVKEDMNRSIEQRKQLETEAFNETVELILASQLARENEIELDEKLKERINWYLNSTVNGFGGIEKLRIEVGKQGATYQDGVNYFTYGVLKEEVKRKVSEDVEPSMELMLDYYRKNEKAFIHPAKAIVQHIIIPTKDRDENSYSDEIVEKQRQLADEIMDRIKAGEDFEELRKKYSVDYFADTASKPEGFEVIKGQLSISRVFEDTVFALEPGQISDVFKSYRGFHIIKLISKTEESIMTFEESRERIMRDLDYTAKTSYFNDLMEILKEESFIENYL